MSFRISPHLLAHEEIFLTKENRVLSGKRNETDDWERKSYSSERGLKRIAKRREGVN